MTQPILATLPSAATRAIDPEAILTRLFARIGRYAGQGVDPEGRAFRAELDIEALLGRGLQARFRARRQETGEVFHEEALIFARDGLGGLCLWVLTGEATGVERLELVAATGSEFSPTEMALQFAVGLPEDRTSYRAAMRMVVRARGALELVWSCGLPGGDFAERSGLRLRPIAS